LRSFFGSDLDEQHIAGLTGADGGKVTVRPTKWQGTHAGLLMHVDNPEYTADRIIFKEGDKLVCHNSEFHVHSQGNGVGAQVFGRQIDHLKQQGFSRIEATCAGQPGNPKWNGYITWAKFGYDGPIPSNVVDKLPAQFQGIKNVQGLMATEEGAQWWAENGSTFKGTFDLADGSLNMNRWHAYLAKKGKKSMTWNRKNQPTEPTDEPTGVEEPDFTDEDLRIIDEVLAEERKANLGNNDAR
jgi:hypothetical protein